MRFHDLTSSWALSPEDRRAYLKAAERDARLYGPDGHTRIGKRAVINGRSVVMTASGWR